MSTYAMCWRVAILLSFVASALGEEIRISCGGAKAVVVTRDGNQWKLAAGGKLLSLIQEDSGRLVLRQGNVQIAGGNRRGDRLELQAAEATYLKFELKAEKTLVWFDAEAAPIEFKAKGDEIKVRQGKVELGKVKYYAKTRKVKAKKADSEIAVLAGPNKATAAAGAFLVPAEIPEEKRFFTLLVLLALGR